MALNDLDLIEEIRAGSHAAFDSLIRRHENFVFRIAYSYVGEAESALDISQNVFIKIHRNLNSFKGNSTFRTWLTRVTQNESSSWLRSQKRHSGHQEITPVNAPTLQPVQEKAVVRQERTRDLLAEVHSLNPQQRQAVLLRYFEMMPVRDIGDVLECSEGQVKSLLFRGLQVLRKRLPQKGRWDQEFET